MEFPLSGAKILKTKFTDLLSDETWSELLIGGKFYEFEKLLYQQMLSLYDEVCEGLIKVVSTNQDFLTAQKTRAEKEGLNKLEFRESNVRLRTGTKINYLSLYAKIAPSDYVGSRHMSSVLWQTKHNCSPMYQSIICLHSVLCPSFSVSKSLLNYQGIHANYEKSDKYL